MFDRLFGVLRRLYYTIVVCIIFGCFIASIFGNWHGDEYLALYGWIFVTYPVARFLHIVAHWIVWAEWLEWDIDKDKKLENTVK